MNELKKMFVEILQNPSLGGQNAHFNRESILNDLKEDLSPIAASSGSLIHHTSVQVPHTNQQPVIIDNELQSHYEVDESLNIMDKEKELILKALKKHRGRRKDASTDLGISERTLYRKIKEYDIEE